MYKRAALELRCRDCLDGLQWGGKPDGGGRWRVCAGEGLAGVSHRMRFVSRLRTGKASSGSCAPSRELAEANGDRLVLDPLVLQEVRRGSPPPPRIIAESDGASRPVPALLEKIADNRMAFHYC